MTKETFKGEKILEYLTSSKKNAKLELYNDYYEGRHWLDFNYSGNRTLSDVMTVRTTRSGKIGWKDNKENPEEGGIPQGLIKTWNLIKMAIDTYATYTRGNADDHTQIVGEQQDLIDSLFPDKDDFVINACLNLSIAGFVACEYDEEAGLIKIIDPRMIFPILDGDNVEGILKAYEIDEDEVENYTTEKIQATGKGKNKKFFYWEAYFEGIKYTGINDEVVDEEAIDIIPITYVENQRRLFAPFNFNNVPIGDVELNIDIQDDINIFETDINIINRYVAIPMKRIASKVFEKMVEMGSYSDDVAKLREQLEKVSISAGKILSAPIENMEANPLSDSTVNHLNDMLEQFLRQTGIPRSVINSEGLSNIAMGTMQYITESLKKRVEQKRTKIAKLIRDCVQLANPELDTDQIEIIFAPIYEPSIEEKIRVIEAGHRMGMPKVYLAKELLSIMGDTEEAEKVVESMEIEYEAERIRSEQMMMRNEMKTLPRERPVKEDEADNFVTRMLARAGL